MRIVKIKMKEWQKTSYKVMKKASKLAFGAAFDSLYIRGQFGNYLDNFSYSHMKNRYILENLP